MVGVLVHVQSQDRDTAGEALLVSGGGVVDQPCVSRHVGQQDPTRNAGESICQGDEFVAPALHGPEIASDCLRHRLGQGASSTFGIACATTFSSEAMPSCGKTLRSCDTW